MASTPAPTALDAELTEALRARGHRVTPQRLVIHRTVRELGRHLSAEEVLAAVSAHLPNVSLPTVYATLELLAELGTVRRLTAGAGPMLFDARTEEHHHLVCRACGRVEDLDAPVDLRGARRSARRRGYAADRAELVISGLCGECLSGGRSSG